jgi:hypothetical protein
MLALVAVSAMAFLLPGSLVVQRAFVVHDMKERLEKEELVTLTVPANAVTWYEEGRECLINGQMFDVKEMEQQGTDLVLKGLFDEKEKALLSRIYALSGGIPGEKESAGLIYRITHFDIESTTNVDPIISSLSGYSFPVVSAKLLTPPIDLHYPPPRLA